MERARVAAEEPKVTIIVNDQANDVADALLTFIVKQDFLNDAQIDALCEWIFKNEKVAGTAAEKTFLQSARLFMRLHQEEMEKTS